MWLLQRWREWRNSREEYRESVEEMRFHIEQETEHNMRRGMSPRAARRESLKAFGGIDRYAEQARHERTPVAFGVAAMSYLDWKLGARMLFRYPGMSVVGGLTLAAAIGLGAGWFEMSMMTLRPDLPLPDGDRIVRVELWDAESSGTEPRALYDYEQWREQLTTLEQVGVFRTLQRNLITPDGLSRPSRVAEISPVAFELTRVEPRLGRVLADADAQPGAPEVAVIGHDVWQRVFGGDPAVIGSTIMLSRTSATIIGVMPEGYGFPRSEQLWVPLRVESAMPREGAAIGVFARLRPGVSLDAAQAELSAFGSRMAAAHPSTHQHLRPRVLPLAAPSGAGAGREVLIINIAAWLLLGAACTNVATLMFARTAMRESEIVVRTALGASRARVMTQLFVEALVLTGVAAILGLAGLFVVLKYLFVQYAEWQRAIPFWYEDRIHPLTILYTALLAVAGAGLVAVLPALRATGRNVRDGIARAGANSMKFGGVWSAMIVLQVAFSVLCLPFGLAAAFDVMRLSSLRAAFPSESFLTFRPELDEPLTGIADSAAFMQRRGDVIAELSRRLGAEPGVAGVTTASALPGTYHPLLRIEAQRGDDAPFIVDTGIEGDRVRTATVGVEYFEALGLGIRAGRMFRHTDIGAGTEPAVAVINEALARSLGGSAVGTRIRREGSGEDDAAGPWYEVVGVVANTGLHPTEPGESEFMFVPAPPADARHVIVHLAGDADGFAPRLRAVAAQVEPGMRLYDVLTLREAIRRYDLPTMQITFIGIGVILLAIFLSAASLYALMSVAVTRRTREIGIRIAIGADPRAVLAALFARSASQIGAGIIIGNVLTAVLLSIIVDEVRPSTVFLPMLIASVVMALVGTAACFIPGRRALRIEPTEALKQAG